MAYHDEFEQALGTGRRKLSRTAKIAISLAAVFLIGVAALGAMAWIAVKKVAQEFDDLLGSPTTVVAERLVDAAPDLELISSDSESGTVTFRNRSTSEVQTVEADEFLEGRLNIHTEDGDLTVDLRADEEGGFLVLRSDDGDVLRLDLSGDEDGGKLVVATGDGEVFRLEAHGDEDGGELIARTDDGEVMRLSAKAEDDGGSFTLDVDGDEVARLDVSDIDGTGTLRIHRKDGSTTTLRGIEEGGRVPNWVPEFDGRVRERKVYHAQVDEGLAGAVRFETPGTVDEVMNHYGDALDSGRDSHSTKWSILGSRIQASLAAEDQDGRTVAILAIGTENGPTHVVVTWSDPN